MMAQPIAVVPQNNKGFHLNDALKLTSEIQQYEKLLKLRDDIVAGIHPRIKLNSTSSSSTATNGSIAKVVGNASKQANNIDIRPSTNSSSLPGLSTISHLPVDADISARSKTRLERQRIERDILESFKTDKNVAGQRGYEQDILPDFDVSEVFFQVQDNSKLLAQRSNRNANSVSGDEETFYSSGVGTEESEEHNSRKSTTKPCKFFFEDGTCKKGDRCNFSHDLAFKQQLQKNAATPQKGPFQPGYTAKGGRIRESPTYDNAEDGELADEAPYSPSMNIAVEELAVPETNGRVSPNLAAFNYTPPNGYHSDNRQQGKYPQRGKDTQIVRNHITSPVAPQPSRVSPLAVAKVSRIEKSRGDNFKPNHQRRDTGSQQSLKSRKRRRDVDSNDQARNVLPRTTMASPEPYIKPEPLSPPPLSSIPQQGHQQPAYPSQPIQYGERLVHETIRDHNGRASARIQTPTGHRRVISGPGPATDPRRQQDLRRIVSTRNFERPVSPGYELRPSISTQYVLPREEPSPVLHRASVQPLRQTYLVEDRPSPVMRYARPAEGPELIPMPPPSGRVVIDEYGNRYLETTVSDRRSTAMPETRYVDEPRRRFQYVEAAPESVRQEPRQYEQRIYQTEHLPGARASVRPEQRYHEERYVPSPGGPRASLRPETRDHGSTTYQGRPPAVHSRASEHPEARAEAVFINPTSEQINLSGRPSDRLNPDHVHHASAFLQTAPSPKAQSRVADYRASEQPPARQRYRQEIAYAIPADQAQTIGVQSTGRQAEEYARITEHPNRMSVKPVESLGRASIRPVEYIERGYRQSIVPERVQYQEVIREPSAYVMAHRDQHSRQEYIDTSPGTGPTYRYAAVGKELPRGGRAYEGPVYLD